MEIKLNRFGLRCELDQAMLVAGKRRARKADEYAKLVSSVVTEQLYHGRREAIGRAMELARCNTPTLFGDSKADKDRLTRTYEGYLKASDDAIAEACGSGARLVTHPLTKDTRQMLQWYGFAVQLINTGKIDELKTKLNNNPEKFIEWPHHGLIIDLIVAYLRGEPVGPDLGESVHFSRVASSNRNDDPFAGTDVAKLWEAK